MNCIQAAFLGFVAGYTLASYFTSRWYKIALKWEQIAKDAVEALKIK